MVYYHQKRGKNMDIKLFYKERGCGEALILLHGNNGDCDYFTSQIEYFSKSFHVIAPDTRGHGRTPRGDKTFALRTFADDLCCFMDELNIEKAHILGFSDGANIAMLFALKYPHKVRSLVLNGGNLNGDGVEDELQASICKEYNELLNMPFKTPEQKRTEEMLSIMINDPNISEKELSNIKAPTLVIAGTYDLIKTEHTKLIHRCIPSSKLVFVEGGHLIAAERSDEFNRAVDDFYKHLM